MSGRDYMKIVLGLLAKAESTDHPEEADAFLAKAQELMAQHAINEAMLADAGEPQRQAVDSVHITCEAPYGTAKVQLLAGIASANDCQAIRLSTGREPTVQVFGYAVDLEHVKALYVHLSMQATRAVLAEPDTTRRFRHAFLVAFAGRVTQRLKAVHRQAQDDYERRQAQVDEQDPRASGRSVGLVLADRRSEVDRAFEAAFPKVRRQRTTVSSATGVAAGVRAGNRADLGESRLHTPTRGAIERGT